MRCARRSAESFSVREATFWFRQKAVSARLCRRVSRFLVVLWAGLGAALALGEVPLGEALPEPPTLPWEERENWAGGQEEDGPRLFVAEYRVQGSTKLDANEIGRAVYPFLGEDRSLRHPDLWGKWMT